MEYREKIKQELKILSDEEYKKFQEKYCSTNNEILGVRIPLIKKYAKELSKNDCKEVLNEIDSNYLEENILYGFVIGNGDIEWSDRKKYISKFVKRIDNWVVCDYCTCSFKFIKDNKEDFIKEIEMYANSKNEFAVRFSLICLLYYYIEDKYIDKIFNIIDSIDREDYYISMAKAWLIAELYIKKENNTMDYLEKTKISDITYNRAIQKILDSNRVEKKKKEVLKSKKRKR